jgi:hypothetical protein
LPSLIATNSKPFMEEQFIQEHLKLLKIICWGKVQEFKTTRLSNITVFEHVNSVSSDWRDEFRLSSRIQACLLAVGENIMLRYCSACSICTWLCVRPYRYLSLPVCVSNVSEKLVSFGSSICISNKQALRSVENADVFISVLKIAVLISVYGFKHYFDLCLLKAVQVCTMCQTSLWWVVALCWSRWFCFTGVKATGWDLLVSLGCLWEDM